MNKITLDTKLIDLINLTSYDVKIKEYIKARIAEVDIHTHANKEVLDKITEELFTKLANLTIDQLLSSTSTNPVQNKVVTKALDGKVSTTRKINGKPLSDDITLTLADLGYDETADDTVLQAAKEYTDQEIANLLNNSTEAVDSIMELKEAMETNKDAIDALTEIAGKKANASDLIAHTNNSNIHVTIADKDKWDTVPTKVDKVAGKGLSENDLTDELKSNYDTAYTHSQAAHAPVNAERNVIVGIQKNGTDITPDSSARKVNIAVPTKVSELTNDSKYLTANGTIAKANQLATPRKIGITGGATGTATEFD